jgi:hypothetical protein
MAKKQSSGKRKKAPPRKKRSVKYVRENIHLTDEQLEVLGLTREEFERLSDEDLVTRGSCMYSCATGCATSCQTACETGSCTAGNQKPDSTHRSRR